MANRQILEVSSAGIVCSLGDNVELVCGAVGAGISALSNSTMLGSNSTPLRMSLIPEDVVTPTCGALNKEALSSRHRRLISIASHALNSLLEQEHITTAPPLFLATPESLPRAPCTLPDTFLQTLMDQTSSEFDLENSKTIAHGRSGGLVALNRAFDYIYSGKGELAIIGGVDTYLDSRLLAMLDLWGRAKVEGSMYGFFPGEGATFLALRREGARASLGNLSLPAFSQEESHYYSDKPHLGEALNQAVASAIQNRGTSSICQILSSHNGEPYYSKEFGVMMTRSSSYFSSGFEHHHPSEFFGDIGAAITPTLILLATRNKTTSLVYGSSDMGSRSAVCVN